VKAPVDIGFIEGDAAYEGDAPKNIFAYFSDTSEGQVGGDSVEFDGTFLLELVEGFVNDSDLRERLEEIAGRKMKIVVDRGWCEFCGKALGESECSGQDPL